MSSEWVLFRLLCGCVHVCMWRPEQDIECLFLLPSALLTCFIDFIESLAERELHLFHEAGWPATAKDLPVPAPNAKVTGT